MTKLRSVRLVPAAASLMLSMAVSSGFAQTIRGTLTGTVTDSSGAVVPGATVTATNGATGVADSAVTNQQGSYTLPLLPPGTYQAVYNGTKAFLDSFSYALREELKDTHVTVTCLMPGATETEFFRRADMMDTKVGTDKKDDPAEVAKNGFEAMMKGEGGVVSGLHNKVQAAAAHVVPAETLAKQHSKMAAPGTAKR